MRVIRNTKISKDQKMVIPAEFFVVAVMTVGITVPIATAIEMSHPPSAMSRYEMRKDCKVGDQVLDVCVYDMSAKRVVGAQP